MIKDISKKLIISQCEIFHIKEAVNLFEVSQRRFS